MRIEFEKLKEFDLVRQYFELESIEKQLQEAKAAYKMKLMEEYIAPCFSYVKDKKIRDYYGEGGSISILGGELRLYQRNRKKLEEMFEVEWYDEKNSDLSCMTMKRMSCTLLQAKLIVKSNPNIIFTVKTVNIVESTKLSTETMVLKFPFYLTKSVEIIIEENSTELVSDQKPLSYQIPVPSKALLTVEEKREALKNIAVPLSKNGGYYKRIEPCYKGLEYQEFIENDLAEISSDIVKYILTNILKKEEKGQIEWNGMEYSELLPVGEYNIHTKLLRYEIEEEIEFVYYKNKNIWGKYYDNCYDYYVDVTKEKTSGSIPHRLIHLEFRISKKRTVIPEDIFVDFVKNFELCSF